MHIEQLRLPSLLEAMRDCGCQLDVVAAIREGAAALVVAHNHPSGDPSPSTEDRRVTERLRRVGELVGIDLLDHVVVGEERFYSFADEAYHPIP